MHLLSTILKSILTIMVLCDSGDFVLLSVLGSYSCIWSCLMLVCASANQCQTLSNPSWKTITSLVTTIFLTSDQGFTCLVFHLSFCLLQIRFYDSLVFLYYQYFFWSICHISLQQTTSGSIQKC